MFHHSQDGVTIASMLDTRKVNKDKKFPVKIRVTYRRDRKYYSTGKDLLLEEWEKLPTTKSKAASELKSSIQTSFETVRKVVKGLIDENGFSFELLNIRLGKALGDTLNTAFRAKIQLLKDEERVGTETTNKNALSSIEKFGGKEIPFSSVTVDWLKKYEKWMLGKNLSYSTIGMYMRALRSIVNDAMASGVIKKNQYPFGNKKYQIPTGEGRKLALTMAMIKKVLDYKDHMKTTDQYRALWVLSYLINGVNMNDLLRLKDSNISDDEIRFFRGKTIRTTKNKKEVIATLTPEIREIIDKWGVPGRGNDDYIFPYLTGITSAADQKKKINDVTKRVNEVLQRIGSTLGIKDFTTYSARHSFATVLKRSGANIAYISESLGHPDVKTTENYLDSFEKEERQKNARMLTDFVED